MEFTYEKREEVKKYLKDIFNSKSQAMAEFSVLTKTDPPAAIAQFENFINDSSWCWIAEYMLGTMGNELEEIMADIERSIETSKEDIEREKGFVFDGKIGTNRNTLLSYECELEIFEHLKEKFSSI